MAKKPKLYQPLTRTASGLGTYSRLWLGADHLMLVQASGFSESYNRFFLRDIKGIFKTPSNRRMWISFLFGGLGIAAASIVMAAGGGGAGAAVVAGIVAVPLLINQLLGPGCNFFVVTEVQTKQLTAIVRQRKADKVLERLTPLIEAAQADLIPLPASEPVVGDPVAEVPAASEPDPQT